MPVIQIVIVLLVVGVGLYLVSLIPMDAKIHTIIRLVVILAVVLWILQLLMPSACWNYRVGHVGR